MKSRILLTFGVLAVGCGDVSPDADPSTRQSSGIAPIAVIALPVPVPVPPTSPLTLSSGTLAHFEFLAPTNGASAPYPVVILKNGDSSLGATTANTMPGWQSLLRKSGYAVVPIAISTAIPETDFPEGVDAVVNAVAVRSDVDTDQIALLGHSGGASASVMVAGATADAGCRVYDPAWHNTEVDAVVALSPKPQFIGALCTGFFPANWGALTIPSMAVTGDNDVAAGLSSLDMFTFADTPNDRRKQSLFVGAHPNPFIGGHGFFADNLGCGPAGPCTDMWDSMARRVVDFLDYTFSLDAPALAQLDRSYDVPIGNPGAVTITTSGVAGPGAPALATPDPIAYSVGIPDNPDWLATCSASGASSGPRRPNGTVGLGPCAGPASDCLHRVTIDTTLFPNATCNDGSPGTFYVRPGRNGHENKWVIHLQGGGACQDGDTCLHRWCGQQNGGNYRANKMSTDWNVDGVSDLRTSATNGGLFDITSSNNNFREWTHVFVYYCSSDSWLGRNDDVAYASSSGVNYSMNNRGHDVVSAVRDMLRVTGAAVPWTPDRNPPVVVPDLDSATHIVFSGTSAGAKGALVNADWFLDPFTSTARTFLVVDGNLAIASLISTRLDLWVDEDGDGDGDIKYYLKRYEEENNSWRSGFYNDINAFGDESCRSFYESSTGLNRVYFCAHFTSLLQLAPLGPPLITTPTFVRLDLQDPVKARRYIETWPGGERMKVGQFGGRDATRDDFTQAMHGSLDFFYRHSHNSVTGIFGPRCSQHVGLDLNASFGDHTTPDTNSSVTPPVSLAGTDSNFHDALWTWMNVAGTSIVSTRVLDTSDVGNPAVNDPFTAFSFRASTTLLCN